MRHTSSNSEAFRANETSTWLSVFLIISNARRVRLSWVNRRGKANVAFVVRLKVAASTIGYLKLPLNQQVRTALLVWIELLFGRLLGTERELKVVPGGRGGYTLCVKSHGTPLALQRISSGRGASSRIPRSTLLGPSQMFDVGHRAINSS